MKRGKILPLSLYFTDGEEEAWSMTHLHLDTAGRARGTELRHG